MVYLLVYIIAVLKFQDFSVIQILREIDFGESNTAVFAIFGALKFVNLVNGANIHSL